MLKLFNDNDWWRQKDNILCVKSVLVRVYRSNVTWKSLAVALQQNAQKVLVVRFVACDTALPLVNVTEETIIFTPSVIHINWKK